MKFIKIEDVEVHESEGDIFTGGKVYAQFVVGDQIAKKINVGVIKFNGVEGLSQCYQFDILLVGSDPNIDLAGILKHPVTFTIHRQEGNVPYHGILADFELHHNYQDYVFYKARLVPRLWWLSLTHHNQVFLRYKTPLISRNFLLGFVFRRTEHIRIPRTGLKQIRCFYSVFLTYKYQGIANRAELH